MSTADQVITCKAAVAWERGKPLSIEDVEVAPPKAHEVRIKIVATGVCRTDGEYLNETEGMKFRPFPLVLGHEAAGVVESIGPEVTKFSPGDHVIPLFLPQCEECEQCQSPKTNQCRKNWANTQVGVLADGTSRISCKGQQVYQFLGIGSFSQYTVVPDTSLTKIRSDAPLDKVCLLGCGVSTGYGAAVKAAKVEKDSLCAVFGLGAVGLAAIMGCRIAGAKTIIGVDVNPEKFEKARMFGATACVNPKDDSKPIQEVLVEKTDGGVDYALECVGSPVIMSAALESTRDGWGTCVIAGWTETETMSVLVEKILMGRTLKGTYFGEPDVMSSNFLYKDKFSEKRQIAKSSFKLPRPERNAAIQRYISSWKSVEDVPKLVDEYMENKLKLDEFITNNLPLDQVNVAFDDLKSVTGIRTVISLWQEEA